MLAKSVASPITVIRSLEGSDTFEHIKRFACSRYADVHQAQLRHFLPVQYVLCQGSHWLASCGLRFAAEQSLFLEQYLDSPIEQLLTERLQRPVARWQIAEVGNLAGEQGSARLMILSLTRLLATEGLEFVVFTATRQLQSAFARLGLNPWFLTDAESGRLGDDAHSWGRYYQQKPAVFAGSVSSGWQAIVSQRALQHVLGHVESEVRDVF